MVLSCLGIKAHWKNSHNTFKYAASGKGLKQLCKQLYMSECFL